MPGDYVITTPIDPDRTWTLPMFRAGIERLDPAPAAVGIVTSPETFQTYFGDSSIYHLVAVHPPKYQEDGQRRSVLEIIAENREKLKAWFLTERTETYQWWIDSDVELLDPDSFSILSREIEEKRCLIYSNGVPGRNRAETHLWHGIGCTLVHRSVAAIGRFWEGQYQADSGEPGTGLCEDLMYFAPYSYGEWVILRCKPSYKKVRVTGSLVPAKHHWRQPN